MSLKDKIYIREFDLKRLKELVKVAEEFGDRRTVQYLEELDEELDRADLVKSQEIPNDVITMNSTFRLRDFDRGEEVVYTLVFPGEAGSAQGKISILAPIGTAGAGISSRRHDRVASAGRPEEVQSRRDPLSARSGGGL